MVELADIRDQESLKVWLRNQPRAVVVWIGARAAARVLPVWWEAVLTEDWAPERDLTALPVLRSILISSVAAVVQTDKIKSSGSKAVKAILADYVRDTSGDASVYASVYASAVYAAVSVNATDPASDASHAARNAAFYTVRNPASHAVWDSVKADTKQVAEVDIRDPLPLWQEGVGSLAETWRAIKWQVANSEGAEDWKFWIEWYDALLEGRPMLGDAGRTWEMLEKIALIDPETWDRGPEAVNPVIREIWELHRLRAEVAALHAEKEAWLSARASEAHRGHNQPPEGLVDDAPEVARQITIIWDALDAAREELERDAPDKPVLRAIAERMLAALNAVVAYCGNVADAVVMSAAKVGGGAVGTALLDRFANDGRLLQFAKDLVGYASGG